MKSMYKLLFAFLLIASTTLMAQESIKYPTTKKVEQVDDYFGTKIQDPYRWLENDTADDVNAWVKEQNLVTMNFLDKIPFRKQIKARLTEILNYEKFSAPSRVGEFYFFSKNDGLQNQSITYFQKGLWGEGGRGHGRREGGRGHRLDLRRGRRHRR
jgi:prolyl oligopeptidase